MQQPGTFFNPGYPAGNQYPSNPPPSYYPPMPSAPAPYNQPYYPTAPAIQQPVVTQQSTNVVVVNPQPVHPRHKDYLCWSIMNFLCCCWVLGIVAIVFSCKTRSDDDRHDAHAAGSSSRTALYLNITSLVIGIIIYILIFAYYSNHH